MRVYADKSFLPDGVRHVVALYPHWGPAADEQDALDPSRYDTWLETGASILELTPIEDAEAAIYPGRWEEVDETGRARAADLSELARRRGIPLLIFFWSDSEAPVDVPGAIVIRTSLSRSPRRPNERAMPAWSEDFVERYCDGVLPVRAKHDGLPIVGFRGAVQHDPLRQLARRLLRRPANPGNALRRRALAALERSSRVATNIEVNDDFWGGALRYEGAARREAMAQARRRYVDNLVASDYALCVRGNGNFSYRLYEALSLGRIPVFVDSASVLPFDDDIDWRRLCVWIDAHELDRIADRVSEHYERHSGEDFTRLQQLCRTTWEERISPPGFFRHLDRLLSSDGA